MQENKLTDTDSSHILNKNVSEWKIPYRPIEKMEAV